MYGLQDKGNYTKELGLKPSSGELPFLGKKNTDLLLYFALKVAKSSFFFSCPREELWRLEQV